MKAQFARRDVFLGELRLSALERRGEFVSDKAPILLLHGLVAEADTFRGLMALLPSDRRVVALDLPGAGYSDRGVSRPIGFRGMAEIVRETIEQLGLDKPVLLGHSHGGAVALQVAVSEPRSLESLILLCPAHPFSGRENALVSFYLSSAGRMFGHMLPRLPDWLHLWAFRHMPGSRHRFMRHDLAPYLHTLRTPGTVEHLLKLLGSWRSDMESLREQMIVSPISVPTLLIWGDKDLVVPISSAGGLLKQFTAAEMETLVGVGHLPNEEAPRDCASLIGEWLSSAGQRLDSRKYRHAADSP